jgi:hypothetical protein
VRFGAAGSVTQRGGRGVAPLVFIAHPGCGVLRPNSLSRMICSVRARL